MTTDFFVARIFGLLVASIISETGEDSFRLCNLSFMLFFLLSNWLLYFTFFYEQNSLFSVHLFNVLETLWFYLQYCSPNYILLLGNITSLKLWTKHIRIQMIALTLSLYGLEKHTKLL